MRTLICCERSGVVREAFRRRGHDAWSNDLVEADDESEFHLQMDCFEAIKNHGPWDLIIMHPPCTYLACSGNGWYAEGKPRHYKRVHAVDWTLRLWECAKAHSPRVVMENPVGILPLKPTQYIDPWKFGHGEMKKTGLWLHGLAKLEPTDIVEGRSKRLVNMGSKRDRRMLKSKTYYGIGEAMAEQFGSGKKDRIKSHEKTFEEKYYEED